MSTSKILVAVSTPWASERLFPALRDLSARLLAPVVVVHVARPTEEDESEDDIRLRGEQTLSSLVTRLKEFGVSCEGLLLYGEDITRAILNAAEAQKATLVVVGLSGKGRFERLLAGDIPQQIVRASTLPVLMFPPDWSGTI
jgi:nucleotide-binding universal stress UspA family protein